MVDEIEEKESLEKEIAAEQQRIIADEKKTRNLFLITGLVVIAVIINIAILYSYVLKPRAVISEKTLTSSPTPIPTISEEPSPTIKPPVDNGSAQTVQNNIKEYFISFGSGSGSSGDWADVEGLLANIDFANYSNIKEIRFEVSTQVPTGNENVSVRIYNKSDNHQVWNSEVTATNATAYLVSQPIIYDKGEKTYQVQLKTQLKYLANITQARLHIILN